MIRLSHVIEITPSCPEAGDDDERA